MKSLLSEEVLRAMIRKASATPPGAFVEVGVFQGGSAFHLVAAAFLQAREIFLYDTFEGIPYKDEIDVHPVGDFKDTSFEKIRDLYSYATVTKGIFPGSAAPMRHVAFAHLDCDQYQSVRESAQYLQKLMVPGGVMWFDDYGCLRGATKAIDELFAVEMDACGKAYVEF